MIAGHECAEDGARVAGRAGSEGRGGEVSDGPAEVAEDEWGDSGGAFGGAAHAERVVGEQGCDLGLLRRFSLSFLAAFKASILLPSSVWIVRGFSWATAVPLSSW